MKDLITKDDSTKDKMDIDDLRANINKIKEFLKAPCNPQQTEMFQSIALELKDSCLLGGDYYDSGKTTVEELIDNYMDRRVPPQQDAKVKDYDQDILALLRQMNQLQPVQGD